MQQMRLGVSLFLCGLSILVQALVLIFLKDNVSVKIQSALNRYSCRKKNSTAEP